MIPFVPCVVRALDATPCDRLFAAYLLGAIGDRKAVPPLLRVLRDTLSHPDLRFSVRQVLAERLVAPEVVPDLVESLRSDDRERRNMDVFLARDGPHDPRILNVLVEMFDNLPRESAGKHSPPESLFPTDRYFVLEAIASQSDGHESDPRLHNIMWNALDDPALMPWGAMLGRKIAGPPDFERFADFFLQHVGADDGGRLRDYLDLLRSLGGDAFSGFLRRVLHKPLPPYWSKACADALVERYFPVSDGRGRNARDPLAVLDENAREAIPFASVSKLQDVLWRAPELSSPVGVQRVAAFWERAAVFFRSRDDLLFLIHYQLSLAHGPEGTGDLGKAIGALQAAHRLDPKTFAAGGYEAKLAALERRLTSESLADSVSIYGLLPSEECNPLTSWHGTLHAPPDKIDDFLRRIPVCFLDYFDSNGLSFTLSAGWRRADTPRSGSGTIDFVVTPEGSPPADERGSVEVRLRILFVPVSGDQLSGEVSSGIVKFQGRPR